MNGKVVVVTGASGALGKVVAEAALARGARVAGVDYAASQTAGDGGPDRTRRRRSFRCGRRPERRSTPSAAHFGRLDALINIAGGFAFEAVAEGDPKNLAAHVCAQRADRAECVASGDPASGRLGRGADRQYRRDGRAAGRRRHGRLRRLQGRRASPHRGARRRMEGQDHRQRRAAVDHRHRRPIAPACRRRISRNG